MKKLPGIFRNQKPNEDTRRKLQMLFADIELSLLADNRRARRRRLRTIVKEPIHQLSEVNHEKQ